MILHTLIRKVHTNVSTISGDTIDDVICKDKDGGIVEIDKNAVNTKIEEYDAQEYARKREVEYPSIAELTIALYDTDDKAAIDAKRAVVKKKWPKDNSGPVE